MTSVVILCLALFTVVLSGTEKCKVGDTRTYRSGTCTCKSFGEGNGANWACYGDPIYPNPIRPKRDTNECKMGDRKWQECRSCKCKQGKMEGETEWSCYGTDCLGRNATYPEKTGPCIVGTIERGPCQLCRCTTSSSGKMVWRCTDQTCFIRLRRDTSVASDLINTPCALNDSFKLDCNTCYCKSDKTGYLCTDYTCTQETSNSTLTVNATTEGVTESINTTDTITHLEHTTNLNISSSIHR